MSQLLKRSARKVLEQSGKGRSYLESRHARFEEEQRQRGLTFYRHLLEPGDLCFDVGANAGNRTQLFRELGARVIAVEPQGSCVEELNRRFGDDAEVAIVPSALGSSPGTAEIAVCDEDTTISTMSARWRNEGRFSDHSWTRHETVPVTTLDLLIEEHGSPSFCKIDVEGFEKQVLEGLSAPVHCISFEFTKEFLDDARACVALLESLGPVATNASFGESMQLAGDWVGSERLFALIEEQPPSRDWGDVYVRAVAGAGD
jgi:FkbM family methyltransferase